MTEKIAHNLYRIPVPLPGNPLRELNAYVIRGSERTLLIDTGFRMDACREALRAGLEDLEIPREEITVLLTHMHSDHAGLGPEFVGQRRPILVSDIDRVRLEQFHTKSGRSKNASRELFARAGFAPAKLDLVETSNPAFALAPVDFERYESLRDGQLLSLDGNHLRCIMVPGHTPGQMCFYIEEEEIMFTGDHVLFDITPNITAWSEIPDSLGNYMESLRKIAKYDVRLALPGHRRPGDMAQRVVQLLDHHQERLEEVLGLVRNNPESSGYHLASLMSWRIRANSWDDFPLAQKWFAVGECLAHLDHLLKLGQIRRELDGAGIYRYFME